MADDSKSVHLRVVSVAQAALRHRVAPSTRRCTDSKQTLHTHGREGIVGKRPLHEIGYHAVRTGDNAGEHTIIFGLLGETLEVSVKASNRDCYAVGALAAAKFVAKQKPGLYNMYDVLGL